MKPQALLQELERAAEQLAVKVSYEQLNATVGHGGLCRVKGQYRVIIDKRATSFERAATLAVALAQLDTSGVRMNRRVREWVDYYRARLAAKPASKLPAEEPATADVAPAVAADAAADADAATVDTDTDAASAADAAAAEADAAAAS